jgi:hypothetical protein
VLALLAVAAAVAVAARHTLVGAEHKLHLIDPGDLVGSGLLVLLGTLLSGVPWRVTLADLGSPLPLATAGQIFFLGQLGKYLPGSVWPVAAQAQLGRRHLVPRMRTATASIVVMALVVVTALLLAALALPLGQPGSLTRYAWAFAFLPVGLLALAPPVLNRLLALALRLIRRPPMERPLSLSAVLAAAGWSMASWLCYGTSIWLLARPLGATSGRDLGVCIGGFALAWTVGFLIVFAPAGGVAREVALTALLLPILTQPAGLAVALVSRLLFTVADIVLGVLAALSRPRLPLDTGAPVAVQPAEPGR